MTVAYTSTQAYSPRDGDPNPFQPWMHLQLVSRTSPSAISLAKAFRIVLLKRLVLVTSTSRKASTPTVGIIVLVV